jgi:putative FmdB family regulatory protein
MEKSMPLYEFTCLDCGAEFESLVWKASETSEVKCPACGGKELEEKISRFASASNGNCVPSGG